MREVTTPNNIILVTHNLLQQTIQNEALNNIPIMNLPSRLPDRSTRLDEVLQVSTRDRVY